MRSLSISINSSCDGKIAARSSKIKKQHKTLLHPDYIEVSSHRAMHLLQVPISVGNKEITIPHWGVFFSLDFVRIPTDECNMKIRERGNRYHKLLRNARPSFSLDIEWDLCNLMLEHASMAKNNGNSDAVCNKMYSSSIEKCIYFLLQLTSESISRGIKII